MSEIQNFLPRSKEQLARSAPSDHDLPMEGIVKRTVRLNAPKDDRSLTFERSLAKINLGDTIIFIYVNAPVHKSGDILSWLDLVPACVNRPNQTQLRRPKRFIIKNELILI